MVYLCSAWTNLRLFPPRLPKSVLGQPWSGTRLACRPLSCDCDPSIRVTGFRKVAKHGASFPVVMANFAAERAAFSGVPQPSDVARDIGWRLRPGQGGSTPPEDGPSRRRRSMITRSAVERPPLVGDAAEALPSRPKGAGEASGAPVGRVRRGGTRRRWQLEQKGRPGEERLGEMSVRAPGGEIWNEIPAL